MGVGIFESTATGNLVEANRIGTNVAHGRTLAMPATACTSASRPATTRLAAPRRGNTIAFNSGQGINMVSGTDNRLSANRIFYNDLIGIDLSNNGVTPNDAGDGDTGANNFRISRS